MNKDEMKVFEFVADLFLANPSGAIDLCNVIAADHGWLPLEIGETMTVGFGDGKEYTITRNKDRRTVIAELS